MHNLQGRTSEEQNDFMEAAWQLFMPIGLIVFVLAMVGGAMAIVKLLA